MWALNTGKIECGGFWDLPVGSRFYHSGIDLVMSARGKFQLGWLCSKQKVSLLSLIVFIETNLERCEEVGGVSVCV